MILESLLVLNNTGFLYAPSAILDNRRRKRLHYGCTFFNFAGGSIDFTMNVKVDEYGKHLVEKGCWVSNLPT